VPPTPEIQAKKKQKQKKKTKKQQQKKTLIRVNLSSFIIAATREISIFGLSIGGGRYSSQ